MKFLSLLSLLALSLLINQTGFSQQSGPMIPSSTENQPYEYCSLCAGAVWDNTNNVSTADGQYSSTQLQAYLNCYQGTCYRSRYLVCYNYGFNIPTNAVVTGIQVDVNGFCSLDSTILDCTMVLRRNNANYLSGSNLATLVPWSATPAIRSYGGADELWGAQWNPCDINSCEFGVYVKLYNPTVEIPSLFVDQVTITVTYAISTTIYSQTSVPQPLHIINDIANGELNISFPLMDKNTKAELQIIDMNGNSCFSKTMEGCVGSDIEEQINTASLSSGFYFCLITSGRNSYLEKFWIVR